MKNRIKLILKELDNMTVSTISILDTFDNELLGLLGIIALKDSVDVPKELEDILNKGMSPEVLSELLDTLSLRKLNSITKKHLIMEASNVEGFNDIEFHFKHCKEKSAYKNDIYSFINAFYFNEYVKPFISINEDDDVKPLDVFNEKIRNIENLKNPLQKVLAYYYLFDALIFMSDKFIEENYKLLSNVSLNLSRAVSVELKLSNKKIFSLFSDYRDYKEELESLNEKISDLRSELTVAKKENRILDNQLKEKKKKEKNEFLREIKREIDTSTKKIQDYNVEILRRSYESLIKKGNQEITDLKINLKLSENKLKAIEEDYSSYKKSINDDFVLNYIENNKYNEIFIDKIRNIFNESNLTNLVECVYTSDINTTEEKEDVSFEDLYNESILEEDTEEIEDNNVLIGYVSIENGEHLVNFPNGNKLTIKALPEKAFLGEGQFITANMHGKYLYSLKQYCNQDVPLNCTLGLVRQINGVLYAIINNEEIELSNNLGFNITESVVGIIEDYKIKKLFKSLVFNVDYFMSSIKAKGFTPYYVVNATRNSTLIRNIENGTELTKNFNECFKRDDVLIVDNEFKIITTFNNSRFYINSSYYENDKYGTIFYKDNKVFFKNVDTNEEGETYLYYSLPEGSIVRLDEFNRFIEQISEEDFIPEKKLRKTIRKRNLENQDFKNIEIVGSVLIIGDIGLQQSYKLASLKKGYIATVLDGYEAYNKVYKEAKKVDKIVIVEDFVDHNIMWELRKNYDNIIYAKNKGANAIAEQLAQNIVSRKQMELMNK